MFLQNEKNVFSRPILTHPAAGPETAFFFGLAWEHILPKGQKPSVVPHGVHDTLGLF